MAILNNLLVGLCIRNGFKNIAKARLRFCANPKYALDLIISTNIPAL